MIKKNKNKLAPPFTPIPIYPGEQVPILKKNYVLKNNSDETEHAYIHVMKSVIGTLKLCVSIQI